MDKDIRQNRILRVPLTILSWVGLVTFADQKYPTLNRMKGYLTILSFVVYNMSEIVFLVVNRNDVKLLTINAGTTALYFTVYIKGWASLRHHGKFGKMYATMHANMKKIEAGVDEERKKILDGYVARCSKIVWYLQVNMTFTCSMFVIYLTLISFVFHEPGEPISPISADTWLPFRTQDHVIPTYLFYVYFCILDALLIPQWNGMMISMLVYATCMLRILQHRLRNRDSIIILERPAVHPDGEVVTDKQRYEFIVGCIKEHLDIIKFVEDLKGIISFPMGVDFVIFILIICGQALLGTGNDLSWEVTFISTYFLYIMLLALLYYWHADEVALEGKELAMAVYDSPWLEDNTAYRNALILMIQRAHRSVTLRAGLFQMNLETYIMIMRISYSAFTILSQINA